MNDPHDLGPYVNRYYDEDRRAMQMLAIVVGLVVIVAIALIAWRFGWAG